jgi:hypothetical protein
MTRAERQRLRAEHVEAGDVTTSTLLEHRTQNKQRRERIGMSKAYRYGNRASQTGR